MCRCFCCSDLLSAEYRQQSGIECHEVVPSSLGSSHNHRGISPVNMVDGKALPPNPSDGTDQLKGVSRAAEHYPTK